MPKTKEQKTEILAKLTDMIERSKSVVFARFDGLTVKANEDLRAELRKEGSEYIVAKKTLFDLAFQKKQIAGIDVKNMDGKVSAVFGYTDEVAPAKILDKFMKTNNGKLEFAGGVLENKFIDGNQVSALAKLPGKQELYAKIVGSINAPVSGFVNVLAGNIRGFVNVLNAIKDTK